AQGGLHQLSARLCGPIRFCPCPSLHCASWPGFVVEQPFLAFEAPAVAGERPVGADHAMTGNNDRNRVPPVGKADGARSRRLPDAARQLAVRDRFTEGNLAQLLPHFFLKCRSVRSKRDVEVPQITGEVRRQLRADDVEFTLLAPPPRL